MEAWRDKMEKQMTDVSTALSLTSASLQHIVDRLDDEERGDKALDRRVRSIEMKGARQAGWIAGAIFVAALVFKGLDYVLPPKPVAPVAMEQIVRAVKEGMENK